MRRSFGQTRCRGGAVPSHLGAVLLLLLPVSPRISGRVFVHRLLESPPQAGRAVTDSVPAGLPGSQAARPAPAQSAAAFVVIVTDENGLAVPLAHVTLSRTGVSPPETAETNYAGRYEFLDLPPGMYHLIVQKETFYAVQADVQVGTTASINVTLAHVREHHERVDVIASPGTINPAKTSSTQALDSQEILNLPYTVPRDIRFALPLLPGVLKDATDQIHINGSSTQQILDELDGFNITDPVSGFFDARIPVEALRSVTVLGSRYPARDGKASGGILDLSSGMGDDQYRYTGTDFLPSFSTQRGLHINSWLPRGSFSGPLEKGKAWFLLAPEFEYNLRTVNELPAGADRFSDWRLGDLAKTQINLTPSNILTTSLLLNEFRSNHAGLSRFDPIETTLDEGESIYHLSVKDQSQLANGMLMEYGIAFNRFHTSQSPMGDQTYVITPDITAGNYFEQAQGRSERWQAIGDIVAPTFRSWGTHEVRFGVDLDRLIDVASYSRHNIQIRREDGTLSRSVSFPGNPSLSQTNFETGGYLQDHWAISDRLVVDPGVRLDWDEIVPGARISPRLAASFVPTADKTKIVAGVGLYHDASNLNLYTQPRAGTRIDTFYDPTGQFEIMPPVQSIFEIGNLRAPWFLNWSAGIERRLPEEVFIRAEFIQKRGHDGWAYLNPCAGPNGCFTGRYTLESARRDQYDAFEFSLRRRFRGGHILFASYTRSAARSNSVLDFNVENPFFSPQSGGPLPWDVPNRLQSWGILPLIRGFDLAYTVDWHSGFPFSVVNENQELVGPPSRLRFPEYFSLNLALEKEVLFFGFRWQLRGGFDNITDRPNPEVVDNNIDSPHFLTYGSADRRSLTGQIRLLGRK